MDISAPCDCGDPDCPGGVPVRHPFGISVDMVSDDFAGAELYLTVRTTSWDFDGERTDLHDVFSLLWAAMLRAREVASGRLVTVLNGFSGIDSEIYARLIRLDQPGTLPSGMRAQALALAAESFDVGNLITDAFGQPSGDSASDDIDLDSPEPQWIKNVRRRYRLAEFKDNEVRQRAYPKWIYFGSTKRGISAVQIDESAATTLKAALSVFQSTSVPGVNARLYRSQRIRNAAEDKALAQLNWLVGEIDGSSRPPLVIPVDSHLIGIGERSLAAVRSWSGRDNYDAARDELNTRRANEARLLFDDNICRWADVIDDGRFELLVYDLLAVERGVHRVRQVGASREPDGGRDLLVEWSTAPDRGGNTWKEKTGLKISAVRNIIVQVKIRQRAVNKGDLSDLRDTLEHYRSDGLLVVGYPRLTVPLMDHLDALRRRGDWWVDWWSRSELEERMRRHPEIAARYPDIVTLTPSQA